MAYSMDFREAVARAHDECGSSAEVAEQFGCSQSWVRRLIQQRRERGHLSPLSTARKTSPPQDQSPDLYGARRSGDPAVSR